MHSVSCVYGFFSTVNFCKGGREDISVTAFSMQTLEFSLSLRRCGWVLARWREVCCKTWLLLWASSKIRPLNVGAVFQVLCCEMSLPAQPCLTCVPITTSGRSVCTSLGHGLAGVPGGGCSLIPTQSDGCWFISTAPILFSLGKDNFMLE